MLYNIFLYSYKIGWKIKFTNFNKKVYQMKAYLKDNKAKMKYFENI